MKTSFAKEEREIDVRELCRAVYHKAWLILLVGISLAALMFFISYFVMEWRYEATTQLYVLSNEESTSEITYTDLETSSYLIKDYMVLITSRFVTNQVITELGLNMEHPDLIKLIQIENPEETRIINITVEYKDPVTAKRIADALRDTTTELITSLSKHQLASRIVEANIPKAPATPRVKYNTVLGGAIGVVVSSFILILLYISDDTIKTAKEVEEYLDVRVLGVIPSPTNKLNRSTLLRKEKVRLSKDDTGGRE